MPANTEIFLYIAALRRLPEKSRHFMKCQTGTTYITAPLVFPPYTVVNLPSARASGLACPVTIYCAPRTTATARSPQALEALPSQAERPERMRRFWKQRLTSPSAPSARPTPCKRRSSCFDRDKFVKLVWSISDKFWKSVSLRFWYFGHWRTKCCGFSSLCPHTHDMVALFWISKRWLLMSEIL